MITSKDINKLFWFRSMTLAIRYLNEFTPIFISNVFVEHIAKGKKLMDLEILKKYNDIGLPENEVMKILEPPIYVTKFEIFRKEENIIIKAEGREFIFYEPTKKFGDELAAFDFVRHYPMYDNANVTERFYKCLVKLGYTSEALKSITSSHFYETGDVYNYDHSFIKKKLTNFSFGKMVNQKVFIFIVNDQSICLDNYILRAIKQSEGSSFLVLCSTESTLYNSCKNKTLIKGGTYKLLEAGYPILGKQDIYMCSFGSVDHLQLSKDIVEIDEVVTPVKTYTLKGSVFGKYNYYSRKLIDSLVGQHDSLSINKIYDDIKMEHYLDNKTYDEEDITMELKSFIKLNEMASIRIAYIRLNILLSLADGERVLNTLVTNYFYDINVTRFFFDQFLPFIKKEGLATSTSSHGLRNKIPYYSYLENDIKSSGTLLRSSPDGSAFIYLPKFLFKHLIIKALEFDKWVIATTYDPDHFVKNARYKVFYNTMMEKRNLLLYQEDLLVMTNIKELDLDKIKTSI